MPAAPLTSPVQLGIQLLGALVLVSVAVPMILPVFVPLAIISGYIYKRYVAAGREVKRWESVVRSPVSHATPADADGTTCRCYRCCRKTGQDFLASIKGMMIGCCHSVNSPTPCRAAVYVHVGVHPPVCYIARPSHHPRLWGRSRFPISVPAATQQQHCLAVRHDPCTPMGGAQVRAGTQHVPGA